MHQINLTTAELQILGMALRKQPYEIVAPVIASIDRQLAEQQATPTEPKGQPESKEP